MKADKLPKYMAFMMSVYVNMDLLMYGDIALRYSISYHLQQLLMRKYSVYMAVYPPQFKHWMKLKLLIESKKCRMMEQCAI